MINSTEVIKLTTEQMATVKFYIRKSTKDDGAGSIYLRYFDTKDQKFTDTLGYSVELDDWVTEKGRLKENNEDHTAINLELDGLATKILKIRLGLVSYDGGKEVKPTADKVKAVYLHGERKVKPNSVTIIELLQQFMEDPNKEKPLGKSTIATYITAIKHLRIFAEHSIYKAIPLTLRDIDQKFFVNLKRFLTDDGVKGGMELNNSTVNKYISCIKASLRQYQYQYDLNLKYLNIVSRLDTEEDIYFCTYEELEKLKIIHFEDEKMALAVRLFIFACYAPARYKDLWRMAPHHMQNSVDDHNNSIKILNYISGKTKVRTTFPLNTYCLRMIKELQTDEKLLPVPPRDISETLHKAFRESGLFDDDVVKITYRGLNKDPIETIKKRWEVLSFHSSRHAFASNMIQMGGDTMETLKFIQTALGHKKMETTLGYTHLIKTKYFRSVIKHQEGVEIQPHLKIVKKA